MTDTFKRGQHVPRAGVSDGYITQLEPRQRINLTLAVLEQMAKALKVTVGELLR